MHARNSKGCYLREQRLSIELGKYFPVCCQRLGITPRHHRERGALGANPIDFQASLR